MNKIALTYENGEFSLCINDKVVNLDKDMDNSIEKFKQTVKNNSTPQLRSWEFMESKLKDLKDDRLEINNQFRTLTFGVMKYFHNMGRVFYMEDGDMTALIGGYNLFYFIVTKTLEGEIRDYKEVLALCKTLVDSKTNYGITDAGILVTSPAFNYGSVEYNFSRGKIYKGASIEEGSFKEFKEYVLGIIRK